MAASHGKRAALGILAFALAIVPAEASANEITAMRADLGIAAVSDARHARGNVLLTGSKRELRRAVAGRVKGVRWVNSRTKTVKRLASLEGRLTAVGTARVEDVQALRRARAAAARNGVFAQFYRRAGSTLALIEAPNRVARRLRALPQRSAVTMGKQDAAGCSFTSSLRLPIGSREIGAREVFTAPDGCLMVRVYELEVDPALVSYRSAPSSSSSSSSPRAASSTPAPLPATCVDAESVGVGDLCTPRDVHEQTVGADAGTMGADAAPLAPQAVGWAWPDEVAAQGVFAEQMASNGLELGRMVTQTVDGHVTSPQSAGPGGVTLTDDYTAAETAAMTAVNDARGQPTRSSGVYVAWFEDPLWIDVTKVGVSVEYSFYGGCVHNPVHNSAYDHVEGTTGWFRKEGNFLKDKSCGSTWSSAYRWHKNNKFCATRDTHVKYDRSVILGAPNGDLDSSANIHKNGGCVNLLHFNEKLKRFSPFTRCKGDCSRDDDG